MLQTILYSFNAELWFEHTKKKTYINLNKRNLYYFKAVELYISFFFSCLSKKREIYILSTHYYHTQYLVKNEVIA